MIERLVLPDFLDASATVRLRAELEASAGQAATIRRQDGPESVAPRMRAATRLAVPGTASARIRELLMSHRDQIGDYFGIALQHCEEPQFLRYETGHFFVAHQDGNTPLVHDDTRFRRVSVVLFLSAPGAEQEPGSYGGGELVFYGPYSGPDLREAISPPPGTLVAFRSETTHEVRPVTHGERYTIVSWFR